jgi:3-methyladenine DNA glycosylase AlkD
MSVIPLKKDMLKLANPKQAALLQGFFKTGPGQYGEGDIFLGIKVPEQRKVAKKYKDLSLNELQELLKSKIHEHRLTSLIILVDRYEKAKEQEKKNIFDFYMKNTENINNWDLVDISAPNIVGGYLNDKEKSILYQLAVSKNLWEKRISILATSFFIKNSKFDDTLKISELLIKDEHDLIHKAVGWMLREVGKKSQKAEENFLKRYYKTMPRTMLRYSIEKFDEKKRKFYLS